MGEGRRWLAGLISPLGCLLGCLCVLRLRRVALLPAMSGVAVYGVAGLVGAHQDRESGSKRGESCTIGPRTAYATLVPLPWLSSFFSSASLFTVALQLIT